MLQPLDLAVFKSLKDKWDQKLCVWQRKHSGSRIPKKEFALLLGETWKELSPAVISSGFRKGGVSPFNRFVVPKEKFDIEALKRWEIQNKNKEIIQNNRNEPEDNDINEEPMPPTVSFENILLETVKNNRPISTNTSRKRIAGGAEVITALEIQERREKQNNSKDNEPKKIKEKEIKLKHNKKKQKYICGTDSDSDSNLTEPEYMDTDDDAESFTDLENVLDMKATLQQNEKNETKKAGIQPENTDIQSKNKDIHLETTVILTKNADTQPENNDIVQIENTHIQTENSGMPLKNINMQYEDVQTESYKHDTIPKVGMFVEVKFSTKKTTKIYVGKILEELENNIYYATFLRQIKTLNYPEYYIFPQIEDSSLISAKEIIKILENPTQKRGRFYFEMLGLV